MLFIILPPLLIAWGTRLTSLSRVSIARMCRDTASEVLVSDVCYSIVSSIRDIAHTYFMKFDIHDCPRSSGKMSEWPEKWPILLFMT